MSLVTAEDQHVAFIQQMVFADRDKFDLAAAGFRDSTYPNNHPHRKRVYFYDADGNDWEFVQYFTDDIAKRNDYDLPD